MTAPEPSGAAQRLASYTPLREEDLAHVVAEIWRIVSENSTALTNLETQMADVSELLNQVAADVNGPLNTSVTELIASEKAALARVAELEGRNTALEAEDAGESAAAQAVREAFDNLAGKFTQDPGAPDVEPLPEPTPDPEPAPSPEPVPGDGSTDVINPTPNPDQPVDDQGNPV